MSEVFSSNSEAALQRTVDVTATESHGRAGDLEELYQIRETCHFIQSKDFKKVGVIHFVLFQPLYGTPKPTTF